MFLRDVIANVKLYKTRNFTGDSGLEAETSIVGRGPVRLVTQKKSATKKANQIDVSKYEIDYDKAVDLEKYDATLNETHTYSIDKEASLTVGIEGLNLPIGISAEINAQLSSQCSCMVSLAFAPGFVHQPYWEKRNRGLLPFWSIRQ
jgi:hypothetical protein